MKILFVLSQTEVTGAETYALALAAALRDRGHELVLVSDTLKSAGGFKFHPVPVHGNNESYFGKFKSILALKDILRSEKIELIHSHSRAANLACHFASRSLGGPAVPMVATVHGRWRNTFAFRRLPCLGRAAIAVCPYLQRYLVEDIGIPRDRVRMVPNGIDTVAFSPPSFERDGSPELLFVGRFSGQKGNVVRFLLKEVFGGIARKFPGLRIKLHAFSPSLQDKELVRKLNGDLKTEAASIMESGEPSEVANPSPNRSSRGIRALPIRRCPGP